MPPSGHRLRDTEHPPLLTENDNNDSLSFSSFSEADVADGVWVIAMAVALCGDVCHAAAFQRLLVLCSQCGHLNLLVLGTTLTDPRVVPKGKATEEHTESVQLQPQDVIYTCLKGCCIERKQVRQAGHGFRSRETNLPNRGRERTARQRTNRILGSWSEHPGARR
ncbi:Palmitoyltransferase ZDHHC7 [Plecturocebus cupreus]